MSRFRSIAIHRFLPRAYGLPVAVQSSTGTVPTPREKTRESAASPWHRLSGWNCLSFWNPACVLTWCGQSGHHPHPGWVNRYMLPSALMQHLQAWGLIPAASIEALGNRRGCYLLVMRIPAITIAVGALGPLIFQSATATRGARHAGTCFCYIPIACALLSHYQ